MLTVAHRHSESWRTPGCMEFASWAPCSLSMCPPLSPQVVGLHGNSLSGPGNPLYGSVIPIDMRLLCRRVYRGALLSVL